MTDEAKGAKTVKPIVKPKGRRHVLRFKKNADRDNANLAKIEVTFNVTADDVVMAVCVLLTDGVSIKPANARGLVAEHLFKQFASKGFEWRVGKRTGETLSEKVMDEARGIARFVYPEFGSIDTE